jgi:peptide/nickel transport system ATP-binding protein
MDDFEKMNGEENNNLVKVQGLSKYYPLKGGFFETAKGLVKAVDNVSFTVQKATTFGLVGESGCGKTTTGRMVVRVLQPTKGEIWYYDESSRKTDVTRCSKKQMQPLRQDIQMIFQDPYASLDPRMTILNLVGEPLRAIHIAKKSEYRERIAETLQMVGLRPEYMNRYPHAFSGGQRQRIGIARALVTRPRLVVADEPVSALDVSVQAQILNLLQELQEKLRLAYIFIAHDLCVIRHVCERIGVMYLGRLVEVADCSNLFSRPGHPYTEALLSIIPRPDPRQKTHKGLLKGSIADASSLPSGCYFHPRCLYAESQCRTESPELRTIAPDHQVACHFNLELRGIEN